MLTSTSLQPQAIIERYRTFLLYMLDTLHDAPGVQEMREMIPGLQWLALQPEVAARAYLPFFSFPGSARLS